MALHGIIINKEIGNILNVQHRETVKHIGILWEKLDGSFSSHSHENLLVLCLHD